MAREAGVSALFASVLSLPAGALLVGAIFFGLLTLASIGVLIKISVAPRSDDGELWARTKTWWWIVSLLLGAMALGRGTTVAFFCLVSFLALREHLSMIPTMRRDRRVLFWAYGGCVLQYVFVYLRQYDLFLILIPIGGVLILTTRMVGGGESRAFIRRVGTIELGVLITVFNLSHIAYLTALPTGSSFYSRPTNGAGLIVFLVALTQINDVAQYIWGRSMGRRKISPTISPNKTLAGFVGGVLTTSALGAIFGRYLTPLDTFRGALVGLAIGITGVCGDLSASALKRDVGVKDTGAVLPGHGGVFDRVDSLTFTAPIFFHLIRFMYFPGANCS